MTNYAICRSRGKDTTQLLGWEDFTRSYSIDISLLSAKLGNNTVENIK